MAERSEDGTEVLDAPFRPVRERFGELGPAGELALALAGRAPPEMYLVAPIAGLDQMKTSWNAFLEVKRFLMDDPDCYDEIGGIRDMNRTGATRLATAFGLSLEIVHVDESTPYDPTRNLADIRFQVRVRASRGPRYADGIASCRVSEIPATTKDGKPVSFSQREHFALTRASTRATKRAIADIVGGTEAE